MSRIGKLPVELQDTVKVKIEGNTIMVEGPKGKLSFNFSELVEVKQEENTIVVTPKGEESSAMWGTTRSVINNMVVGVAEGYKKSLEINGVGYKFEPQGQKLVLSIGYSHKVEVEVPTGLTVVADEKVKNVIH
ncbi:MAG TPA: 50S ribosomal protein L6, partial [Candidatus Dojkabacteria bacterium]|nr:50S ribosomal protein L6 [Candidatus Dojkabacteria bacterium]